MGSGGADTPTPPAEEVAATAKRLRGTADQVAQLR
jgi:hypothetical protein